MTQGRGSITGLMFGSAPSACLGPLLLCTGCMGTPVPPDPSSQPFPGLQHPCSRCRQQAQLVPWSPGCARPLSPGQPGTLLCPLGALCLGFCPPEGSAHTGCAKPGLFFPAELLLPPDCLNFGSIKVQAVQIEPDARSSLHRTPRLMSPSRAQVSPPSPEQQLQP